MAKEKAIADLDALFYCGEEDLLAHYFTNFDSSANGYTIGSKKEDANCIFIQEGEWEGFITSTPYRRRKEANSKFQLWDELIQRTAQNAFDGVVKGNGNMFNSQSAIFEMAMEPRFFRRDLSEFMVKSIRNFPEHISGLVRNVSFMPSFYKDKGYVFLQVKPAKREKTGEILRALLLYNSDPECIRLTASMCYPDLFSFHSLQPFLFYPFLLHKTPCKP